MKLINLIRSLILGTFNLLFYIICSPILIPIWIWKQQQNKKWRKNIKIGDECFFMNIAGTKSWWKVRKISDDGLSVGLDSMGFNNFTSIWENIEELRIK